MAVITEEQDIKSGLKFTCVSGTPKQYETSGQVICIQVPAPLAGNRAANVIR
jgi:hypothetical protein